MTFIEQEKLDVKQTPDAGLPRIAGKQCPILSTSIDAATNKQFTCNFKVNGKIYGMKFPTYHKLNKHKTLVQHKKLKKVAWNSSLDTLLRKPHLQMTMVDRSMMWLKTKAENMIDIFCLMFCLIFCFVEVYFALGYTTK